MSGAVVPKANLTTVIQNNSSTFMIAVIIVLVFLLVSCVITSMWCILTDIPLSINLFILQITN